VGIESNKYVTRSVRLLDAAANQLHRLPLALAPQANEAAEHVGEIAEKLVAMQNNEQQKYLTERLASAIEDVIVDFEKSAQNLPKELRKTMIRDSLSDVFAAVGPALSEKRKAAVSPSNPDRQLGEDPQKEVAPLNYPTEETRTQ
jgi:hypothetical protein